MGCCSGLYIRTGECHCSWICGNRKIAEGEAEPGKKVNAAPGHSFIQSIFIEHLLYARYSSMDRGYRSGEILLPFMVIALVNQTVMKNKYYSQEKNSYARGGCPWEGSAVLNRGVRKST